ncbi:amidohydrolase [Granulosicoccus sp.]|nr:amidohydrolase [Granulosicoccus sp.]MDB4224344.1 amidohydrolase [Granulosicoccus sp.]
MIRAAFCLAVGGALMLFAPWPNIRPVLLVNAHIVTMDAQSSIADALLFKGGRIVEVGSEASIKDTLPLFTRIMDMQGSTILPGFIDAHSHFPAAGLTEAGIDLMSPPMGNVATLQILLKKVSGAASTLPANDWIVGFNYDDSALDVARHPTRDELDQVAPNHPVYLWHRSGHMGVANSLALEALGFDEKSLNGADIDGIGRPDRDGSGRLTGLLQEGAAPRMSFLLRQLSVIRLFRSLLSAKDQYLSAGITTAQNGFADIPSMRMLRWSQRLGLIPQRLVIWPAHDKVEDRLNLRSAAPLGSPAKELATALDWTDDPSEFAITAIKLIADGSPQGRTAWLTEPYLNGSAESDYRGFASMPTLEFKLLVKRYHNAGFQLAMHGNGDAAIDLIIAAVAEAQAANYRDDSRHILVHGQLIRADQMQQLAELQISATFFPSHVHYWGDWYLHNLLGAKRANTISPLALAEQTGVRFSIHSDAPVTPISPMQVMWSAITRETLSGTSLGSELIIDREQALRAMTIDAAWQSRLEHDRGSLEVGKLADFIVLSEDPLTYPEVRNIDIEQIWIGGRNESLN